MPWGNFYCSVVMGAEHFGASGERNKPSGNSGLTTRLVMVGKRDVARGWEKVKPITWLKGHCKWLTKLIANKQAVPKGPIPSWMLSPACHSLSKSIAEFVKSKNFTLLVSFSIHQYMHKHKVLTFVFFDKPKLSGRSLPYQWWYLFFVWWFFELMYLLLMPCQFKPFLLLRSYFLHLKS